MKPKTKLQIRVDSLSKTLPKVSEKQMSWGYKKAFNFFVWKSKHLAVCFECGHRWNEDTTQNTKNGIVCPECGKLLIPTEKLDYRKRDDDYFCITTVCKEFQVLRYFFIERYCYRGKESKYFTTEICQQWINPKGTITIMAVGYSGMFGMCSWNTYNGLEIKHNSDKYNIYAYMYPYAKYTDLIKRNGFDGNYYKYFPANFFHLLLSDNTFEKLIKMKRFEFLKAYSYHRERIIKNWKSILVCTKRNYPITNISDWLDQLELLEFFGKDLLSPKYICPVDLKREHQKLIEKKQKLEDKEKFESLLIDIKKNNIVYRKSMKKFFDIKFTDDELEIVPLKNVKEFYTEGAILKHCIFINEYYKNKGSLILSARKGTELLETIQIDLRSMDIIQCRGADNENTIYHDRILKLMKKNLNQIKKIK